MAMCCKCGSAPRMKNKNGRELTMCETCQRAYWRETKKGKVGRQKAPVEPKAPAPKQKRGRKPKAPAVVPVQPVSLLNDYKKACALHHQALLAHRAGKGSKEARLMAMAQVVQTWQQMGMSEAPKAS